MEEIRALVESSQVFDTKSRRVGAIRPQRPKKYKNIKNNNNSISWKEEETSAGGRCKARRGRDSRGSRWRDIQSQVPLMASVFPRLIPIIPNKYKQD